MVYRGTVVNGRAILDGGVKLPEGQLVVVRPLKAEPTTKTKKSVGGRRTLYERFKPFIGIAKGLPPDFSSQHDHYIHGTPKRNET